MFNIDADEKMQTSDIVPVIVSTIWISGFAFPELGSIESLNFNFSSNIYLQIPFLKWVIDLRMIFTILFSGMILIKPLFIIDWKLEKKERENSINELPTQCNTFIIIVKAIENGAKRASNYLNRIISSIKIFIFRYFDVFLKQLELISHKIYSILLMTIPFISVFISSRIVEIQSSTIIDLLESRTFSDGIEQLVFVIINTLLIYLILIINWLLFNKNIFFTIKNIDNFNKAIWYVFYEYSQILIVKIPGFLFIVSIVAWSTVSIYNLFANKPFIYPGIYIIICFSILIIYLVINRIKHFKKKANL